MLNLVRMCCAILEKMKQAYMGIIIISILKE